MLDSFALENTLSLHLATSLKIVFLAKVITCEYSTAFKISSIEYYSMIKKTLRQIKEQSFLADIKVIGEISMSTLNKSI